MVSWLPNDATLTKDVYGLLGAKWNSSTMNTSNVQEIHGIWQFRARSFENVLSQDSLSEFETVPPAYKSGTLSSLTEARCVWLRQSVRRSLHNFHIYLDYVLFTPHHGWAQLLSSQWRYCFVNLVLVTPTIKQAPHNKAQLTSSVGVTSDRRTF